ncbi:Ldh family oxidoreductase [Oscillochloris sp. ZM17-4]|uniref:Ldh family oxidoreductase n=1 Tax=Oscillochloris sp. ZM17-4 TaxID=2866714 RepID=UPI001C7358FF|nr:Ldh family oxidoreductase [Oscillochloris sp. ZM17-4]MBX0326694.1 Ldh family oxidoreductase [Oscillochloris sp. ZM17-4]
MPIVSAPRLRRIAEGVIAAIGTDPDIAQIVAGSLVEANLVGHDSHGVLWLP